MMTDAKPSYDLTPEQQLENVRRAKAADLARKTVEAARLGMTLEQYLEFNR